MAALSSNTDLSIDQQDEFDRIVAARDEQRKTEESERRQGVAEVVLYLCFLATFSLVVLNMRNPTFSFIHNELMKDLFLEEEFPPEATHILKTYHDVATEDEFWQFMTGVFVPNMFSDENAMLYGTNRIIGTVRLRQNRVSFGECELPSDFEGKMPPCLPRYRDSIEEKGPFGGPDGQLYTYQSAEVLSNGHQLARVQRFGGGGYLLDLDPNYSCNPPCTVTAEEEALRLVQGLQDNGFVDKQTRAFFIDFTTFNANINMFFVGQIAFEFMPSGGVLPSSTFRVLRLYNYERNIAGTLTVVGEVLMVAFIIFYFIEELLELTRDKKKYLHDGWNLFDLTNLILFLVVILLRIRMAMVFSDLAIDPKASKYFNFRHLQFLEATKNNLIACNGFLLWFKIFKYTRVSPQMSLISRVIVKSSGALASFTIMFVFVLFGFAQSGNMAFGTDVQGYGSFASSLMTLLVAMLGEFDFEALQRSNRAYGPFFFFSFIVLVFLIILSMFLAIVDNSYREVQEEIASQEETTSLLKKGAEYLSKSNMGRNLMGLVLDDEELARLQKELAAGDENQDGFLDRDEANKVLGENADLFAEFDKDGDMMLNSDELEELQQEIERRRANTQRAMQQISKGDVNELDTSVRVVNNRIKTLDEIVANLSAKVAVVLEKMGVEDSVSNH